MLAPRIVAVGHIQSGPHTPAARCFLVVEAGEFHGSSLSAGDVLVCEGPADERGAAVVLVPAGVGRPMVGTVEAGELFGDAGEPCRASRWHVAGRIASVVSARGACRAFDYSPTWRGAGPQGLQGAGGRRAMGARRGSVGWGRGGAPGYAAGAVRPRAAGQLSLFAEPLEEAQRAA